MQNLNINVLSADDDISRNGSAIRADQLYAASFVAIFSDVAAAGTVKLQASNDKPQSGSLAPFTPTNWKDISGASATVVAGVAPIIPKTDLCYQWIRVVFTQTNPGIGTINVMMNAQGF